MPDIDAIIVGTGPAGVHAAWPLAEAGKNIVIIDGGYSAPEILKKGTMKNFEDVRRFDVDQWKYFLGEDFSSIPLNGLKGGLGGGQITGNRSYVLHGASEFLPLETDAQVLQSLAQGGLGAVWGAAGAFLENDELEAMGLPATEIQKHYDIIARRIGISGPRGRISLQPALKLDQHGRAIIATYEKKKHVFDAMGMVAAEPSSAVLTEDLGERKKTEYADMDYWSDPGKSVYRPQFTLEELQKFPNVQYEGGYVVKTVREVGANVIVTAISTQDRSERVWECKRTILAAGAVSSARIVLESNEQNCVLPFIGKPHVFIPCLRMGALGTSGDRERVSLCQAVVIDNKRREGVASVCAQLYSYRSMLLFRLLSAAPIPTPFALHALRILAPCLIIADVRFPGLRRTGSLHRENSKIVVKIDEEMCKKDCDSSVRTMKRALRTLGLWTLPTMPLAPGSTWHYGGSIPIGSMNEHPFTADQDCRLHGSTRIFVADASVFRILPAKPHTFTIMANANRVGGIVRSEV